MAEKPSVRRIMDSLVERQQKAKEVDTKMCLPLTIMNSTSENDNATVCERVHEMNQIYVLLRKRY